MAKVWPGLFIEEVTLRVHVTALRKAPRHPRRRRAAISRMGGPRLLLRCADVAGYGGFAGLPTTFLKLTTLCHRCSQRMVGRDEIV